MNNLVCVLSKFNLYYASNSLHDRNWNIIRLAFMDNGLCFLVNHKTLFIMSI